MARVRVEKKRSRPRSSVVEATTATRIGRHRGDDGEQADDLHVQPRAGVAAPARLDHRPDFAADDAEQQDARSAALTSKQRDDDLVGRRDRGQAGEHQEGRGAPTAARCRPRAAPNSRDAHRRSAPPQRPASSWARRWSTVVMDAMKRGTLAAPNEWTPRPFAPDDAFIQQCCRIATIRRRRFSARCECATWLGPKAPNYPPPVR